MTRGGSQPMLTLQNPRQKQSCETVYCEFHYNSKNNKGLQMNGSLAVKKWAHLGMIQGPPDYESGALTN
jgi:hypothetical protein